MNLWCASCGIRRTESRAYNDLGCVRACKCGCAIVTKNDPAHVHARKKPTPKAKQHKRAHKPISVGHSAYITYIGSKKWEKKREKALQHFGRKCAECGSTTGLHVHHKTYENLGRERMEDLQILCGDCHGIKHESKYRPKDTLSVEFRQIAQSR